MLPVNRLHNTAAPALHITIPSSTARNGTISRPPHLASVARVGGSTYISLMSARTLATFALRKLLARVLL